MKEKKVDRCGICRTELDASRIVICTGCLMEKIKTIEKQNHEISELENQIKELQDQL